MSSKKRVAVVTGGNRGIGKEIVRQLAQKGFQTILTSRDEQKGVDACRELKEDGLYVGYCQLEMTNVESINRLASFIRDHFGQLDILVNNAGILLDSSEPGGSSVMTGQLDTIRTTMETNVYGPLLLCQAVIPLMKENNYGRIVNVSSGMGQLSDMGGGYPAYRLSKVSLNALTRIFSNELEGTNILVNTMCPGWVKTDMGGENATRSVAEGADTAVWLASLEDGGPTGKFFRDRSEIPW